MKNTNRHFHLLFVISFVAALGLSSVSALAAPRYRGPATPKALTNNNVTTGTSTEGAPAVYVNGTELRYGLGIERIDSGVLGAPPLNELHLSVMTTARTYAGLGFGFSNDFNNAIVEGDFRYDLVKLGEHAFFAQGLVGWERVESAGHFAAAALMGFDYGLTPNLHATFAYGLHLLLVNTDDHVGITPNEFTGNFGLHWYFL